MTMSVVDGIMGANLQNKEPSAIAEPSVIEIGNAFARQYYQVLCEDPRSVHKFYGHDSTLLMNEHPQVIGQERIGRLLEDMIITEKSNRIKVHNIKGGSIDGTKIIMILVFGEIAGRRFTQTFLLASQGLKKYYIQHDSFMFCDLVFTAPRDEHAVSISPPALNGHADNIIPPVPFAAQVTVEKTIPVHSTSRLNGHAEETKVPAVNTPEKPKTKPVEATHTERPPKQASNEDKYAQRETKNRISQQSHEPKKLRNQKPELEKPTLQSGPKTWANVLGGGGNAKTSVTVVQSATTAPTQNAGPQKQTQKSNQTPSAPKAAVNGESPAKKKEVNNDRTLFIGGIQRNSAPENSVVVEAELKEIFSKYGDVEAVSVPAKSMGINGETGGTAFAFVIMKTVEEVQKVMTSTTKGDRDQNRLSIKVSTFGHDGEVTVAEQSKHDRERYNNNRGRGGHRGNFRGVFRGARGGGGAARGGNHSGQN